MVVTSAEPVPLGVATAALCYLIADGRVRRAHGRVPRQRARLAFFAGLGVVVIALTGPIDAAVTTSFSIHMVQHLLITMVAPPLLLLGAPITLALQAWPGTPRRWLLATLRSGPARLFGNPLVAWALFFVVLWGIHFTGIYEAALHNNGLHALEHLALLVTALLFWMPIVRADPAPSGLSYPARILYLFAAMPAMAFLGLTIVTSRHVLYPTYAHADGVARALADQGAAGAIMWAGTMVLIVPALGFVLLDWMRADEREAARVDARLERATMRGA
ncbi:MAG: cytochrome c oxidase assembly protein [Actinobacteria bacterium]|nr:MAG: cytochrome c oxidase assembly protein [Actinomycetota bacterium]TMK93969.1 MAG: cytochrome c oxidase assembly protein [Actinomycetota bacterium]TMM22846.1 MAG: cytochrome c oxidase assembly protein [Actinomycetota bacterium]